mmetsp:Transcript_24778/g.55950  ORF Transcript_24778/g.55950 Transcript_24778/m.55950 type:complete len:101 (-) Transcript_24778:140-442(-)|eukprot:768452-Hanusia_phi.AAC.15
MGMLSWVGLGGKKSGDNELLSDDAGNGGSQADKVKQVYQKHLASKYLNELASQISFKCFMKCSNESAMNTSEDGCTALCCDRYLDTINFVRQVMSTRNSR